VFAWDEFLTLASVLEQSKGDEACQRTAISRAYYAAYHVVTTIVVTEKAILSGHPKHQIWNQLQDVGRARRYSAIQDLGDWGRDLRVIRQSADYYNPFNKENRRWSLEDKTTDAIRIAGDIIRLARSL
jgi:hypothetical protein